MGGGKGSAVCGRKERVSCVWEEGKGQLCVGRGKGSAVCGCIEGKVQLYVGGGK